MRTTVVLLVEDKPGVLARVASQFRSRRVNIESMTAGPTAPGVTTISIVVDEDQVVLKRLTAGLTKLINVLEVREMPVP